MKKLLSCLIATGFIFISINAFSALPDPEVFGKEFIETIKKKSREAYISKYALTKEDLGWISNDFNSNEYISSENKISFNRYFSDTSVNKEMNIVLSENYDQIDKWLKRDTIDINQLSFTKIFYDLKYLHESPFYLLNDISIIVKYKSSYYKIQIRDVAFINNHWRYGDRIYISNAVKTPADLFHSTDSTYISDAVEDTTAYIETDEYSIAEEEMIIDTKQNQYTGLHPKQAKKIKKMQQQIDALYLKMDKEYSKEY